MHGILHSHTKLSLGIGLGKNRNTQSTGCVTTLWSNLHNKYDFSHFSSSQSNYASRGIQSFMSGDTYIAKIRQSMRQSGLRRCLVPTQI